MMIPAVALKILGGTVAVGAVASSIAVPTALSMNTVKEVILKDFPDGQKDRFKNKCQLLTKDEDSGKRELDMGYLLVCDKVNDSGVEFYYFSSREVPKKVISLEKNGNLGGYEVKVKIKTEESGDRAFDLTSTNGDWTDLIGKSLKNCSITEGVSEEKRWSVRCPRGDSEESKNILLTPVIIN